jgi:type 2 lantibiotic biosynthesis protein LanM
MERLDVPHFTVAADSTRMTLPGGSSVEDCFVASACDQQRARLEAMSASNGELQAAFVSASLATAIVPGRGRRDQPLVSPVPILSPDAMMDAAVGIARDLDACAVRAPDGSSRWIGVSFTPEVERYDLAALGLDFYNGAGGITLFLGAVERVTGGAGFRDLALAGLRPLCDALRRGGDLPELRGIGGSWGAGSATYVFTRAAELLDAPDLLDTAASAAALITRERIANDRALDVMSGSAGAILSLLALHARTGDGLALDRAVLCGQHLIQNRATTDAGLRAWPTIGGRLLTGFSHGAAGIAYALLRLYAVTGDADFLCAAEDGFAYERRQFSPTAANWADLRPGHEATFMTSWCHGAPGIGLSRIGALSTIDTPVIREEIEIALTTTMNVGEQGVDQLCCGNAGRADMLIEAGTRLERPEFHDAARLILSTLMARYQAAGQLRLLHGLPAGVYNPPLFRGMAGIGYTLLRMARPGTLPSVLLWG